MRKQRIAEEKEHVDVTFRNAAAHLLVTAKRARYETGDRKAGPFDDLLTGVPGRKELVAAKLLLMAGDEIHHLRLFVVMGNKSNPQENHITFWNIGFMLPRRCREVERLPGTFRSVICWRRKKLTPWGENIMRVRAPLGNADWQWMQALWKREWGGLTMVSRGTTHRLEHLSALIAVDGEDQYLGLITWSSSGAEAEVTSLNAVNENRGVGSALLDTCENDAYRQGIHRVWLITTNDNIRALAFYQKRGYRIEAVFPGAVDTARKDKPEIPVIAANGVPIHDEILLAKWLP